MLTPKVKESFGCHIIASHAAHAIALLSYLYLPCCCCQLFCMQTDWFHPYQQRSMEDYDEENPTLTHTRYELSMLTQCNDKSASYECFSCSSSHIGTLASLSTDVHTSVCLSSAACSCHLQQCTNSSLAMNQSPFGILPDILHALFRVVCISTLDCP